MELSTKYLLLFTLITSRLQTLHHVTRSLPLGSLSLLCFCPHVTNVTNVTNVTSRYKISPIIFAFTIIFWGHVSNVTSHISPIIFTFTIIFCRRVSNVTSGDKISPIIFTFTIIFCRHVSNVTSRDIT